MAKPMKPSILKTYSICPNCRRFEKTKLCVCTPEEKLKAREKTSG